MRKIVLFWLTLITVLQAVQSRKAGRKFHSTTRCRSSSPVDPNEKCNSMTNCRYGGECRKTADFSRQGTTVRFIVPPHLDLAGSSSESKASAPWGKAMHQRHQNHGKELCVCDFKCKRRDGGKHQDVCGSDGNTYVSECHLRRDACMCQMHLDVRNKGPCQTEVAPLVIDIGSVSEEINFKSRYCERTCSFGGTCNEAGVCTCLIECSAQTVSYVCGKDGKTYNNACHVKQAQCRHQKGIDIVHDGPCVAGKQLQQENPHLCRNCDGHLEDPLCGTDDISYLNECVLRRASCIKRQHIEVKHKRLCHSPIQDVIPPIIPHRANPASVSETLEKDKDDPCYGISCHHGAVCKKHEKLSFEFTCSCEDICDTARPIPTKPPTTGPDIIRLDIERGIKSAWAEDNTEGWDGGIRIRKRNNRRRSRRRLRRRQRSARTVEGPRPLIYDIVCGTDGKTYENECALKISVCHQQSEINIAHLGACEKELPQRLIVNAWSTLHPRLLGNTSFQPTVRVIKTETINDQEKAHPTSGKLLSNKQKNIKQQTGEKTASHTADGLKSNRTFNLNSTFEQRTEVVSTNLDDHAVQFAGDSKILDKLEEMDAVTGSLLKKTDSTIEQRDDVVDWNSARNFSSDESLKDIFKPRMKAIDSNIQPGGSEKYSERQNATDEPQILEQNSRLQFLNSFPNKFSRSGSEGVYLSPLDFIKTKNATTETKLQDKIVSTKLLDLKNKDIPERKIERTDSDLIDDFLSKTATEKTQLKEGTIQQDLIGIENEERLTTKQNLTGEIADNNANESIEQNLFIVNTTSTILSHKNISLASNLKQQHEKVSLTNFINLLNQSKALRSWKNGVEDAKPTLSQATKSKTVDRKDDNNHDVSTAENTSHSSNGINVAALVVLLVVGQMIIVATFVGIFVYMKRRKKLKDLSDKTKPAQKDDPKSAKPT